MAGRSKSGLPEALAAIVAIVASFLTMYAVAARLSAGPSAAILSAVLALTLARRQRDASHAPGLTFAMLPLVAIASALVAYLLVSVPIIGAALFVAAMFVSVWLRQFGARAAVAGSLVALPFIALLIAPVRMDAPGGPTVDIVLIICAGWISMGWITVARYGLDRLGFAPEEAAVVTRRGSRASTESGLNVTTRMALQMAVALTAAFVVGLLFFHEHWGWMVITAFIVCSGARGRGDAVYKGFLRLGGALAGTLGAAIFQHVSLPGGVATACAIFAALFLGIWLRERNYAYWAACVTLVLALLQRSENEPAVALLFARLGGILIGAACAVAATWFVYPIRTESVIRRRVADVLAALEQYFSDAPESTAVDRTQRLAIVEHHATEMDRVAPPVEWHRRIFARGADEHPATWIAIARDLLARARERTIAGDLPDHGLIRQAIRHSRRAIGRRLTPQEMESAAGAPVAASLRQLREVMDVTNDRFAK